MVIIFIERRDTRKLRASRPTTGIQSDEDGIPSRIAVQSAVREYAGGKRFILHLFSNPAKVVEILPQDLLCRQLPEGRLVSVV